MSVSPPPLKRRKLSEPPVRETQPQPRTRLPGLTVYAWNVNGITPFVQRNIKDFFSSTGPKREVPAQARLREFLKRHSWPELLFLQEVKINADDSATIKAVERAVGASNPSDGPPNEPDYVARFCLPSDKFNARGFGRKVYGVCSIIRKDFYDRHVFRVRTVDWDKEGRFLVVETKGGNGIPKLAIFNIYAVNGTDSSYKDSVSGSVTGTRHDRKLAVHSLLAAECRSLQDQGFAVILAGDMNIARTTLDGKPNLRTFPQQHCLNRVDFEAKFFSSKESGLAMIDTFRSLYPHKEGYTYYPRTKQFGESCDRVDMIMTSPSLRHAIKEAGMHETPQERGPSDHVPLYARFEFDDNTASLVQQDGTTTEEAVTSSEQPKS